ncbi:hypothetical protein RRG08_011873 [Elysia crispata]|uniref:Uncharacterized protein n=1 Tax=Elysia crispata TaxID=231223 RepID=A0AAE1DJD2_9GAST|nr:hypothetical protein RRG08_011873 [Elysia crispata]
MRWVERDSDKPYRSYGERATHAITTERSLLARFVNRSKRNGSTSSNRITKIIDQERSGVLLSPRGLLHLHGKANVEMTRHKGKSLLCEVFVQAYDYPPTPLEKLVKFMPGERFPVIKDYKVWHSACQNRDRPINCCFYPGPPSAR